MPNRLALTQARRPLLTPYPSAVLVDRPLRYSRYNDAAGAGTVLDLGTQKQNGTVVAGVTLGVAGLIPDDSATCALYNGTSGIITYSTTGLPTGAQPFSIEIIASSAQTGNTAVTLFLGTNANQQSAFLYQNVLSGVGTWKFQSPGGSGFSLAASSPLTVNTPYHLCGTYDGSNVIFYINGTNVASVSGITLNLTYGAAQSGNIPSLSNWWSGKQQEAAIYNYALSATRVGIHALASL